MPIDLVADTTPGSAPASAALEGLYRRDFARLVRVAVAITGDAESGRDAVHEAFAGALAAIDKLRHPDRLDAWVWRAVVNAARDERRRDRRAAVHTDVNADPSLADAPAPPERGETIRHAIATLPERQRLVLFLRYYADLDYDAIARALSIRRGTIGPTLNHAHTALRKLLEVDS